MAAVKKGGASFHHQPSATWTLSAGQSATFLKCVVYFDEATPPTVAVLSSAPFFKKICSEEESKPDLG